MGNRQNCAKFQESLFRSNEIISFFCPPLFRKRPIHCRTGHDDVSRTRMTTLAFILSELFPLDGFRCNFVSAP